jgi:hypothetical protein
VKILCVLDSVVRPGDRWLWNYLPDWGDQVDFAVAQPPDRFGGIGKAITRYPGYFLNAYRALQSARRGDYDAIVAWESKNGLPLAFFRWLGRDSHPPLVLLTFSAKQNAARFGAITRRWLRYVDHLTVPSEWEAAYYTRMLDLPAERVSVCHLGAYDRWSGLPSVATSPGATQGPPYLFSGGLTDRDYRTLLVAVAGSGIRTMIATRPYIGRRLPIPAEVKISDLLSGAEYAAAVAGAQAVVIPLKPVNHAAGLSLVLDAMALGRPVICSAIPAVCDYIEEGVTGLLAPPGDADALRAAIRELLDHPDRAAAMGQAARRRFEERHTFEAFARRAHEIIARVVEGNQRV